MNYLKRKRISFMPYVSGIKGFNTKVSGQSPIALYDCVDTNSIIDYTIYGNGDENSGVGDKTVNLFDSTQLLNASGWSADEDGVYTGKVSSLWGKFYYNGQFDIEIPEDAVRISITWEGKNESLSATTFSFVFFYDDGTSGQVASQYIRTTEWEEYRVQSTLGKRVIGIKAGYSQTDNIYLRNIQVTATKVYVEFEPYGKFKIPVLTRNDDGTELKQNIYLDKPLIAGQSINMKEDSLPIIPTFKGTTVFTVGTVVQPAEVDVIYFSSKKL